MHLQKRSMYRQDKNGIGEDAVSVVVSNAVVYMPLEDLIDKEKEIERLTKEAGTTYKRDRTLRRYAE